MREDYPIPEPIIWNKNLSDYAALLEIRQYSVNEWTPAKDGRGKAEAVIIQFDLGKDLDGISFIIRLKSRAKINRLITILGQYRDRVWPEGAER